MRRILFVSLVAAGWVASAASADLPADVLVKSRWMELTRADYDNAVARVPAHLRFEFSTSPKRVQALLNNLLVTKTLAAQAKVHGTRPAATLPGGESERALAAAELKRIEIDAAKAFDDRKAAFEARARELYAFDKAKYVAPEEVRISDIAVVIKDRGEDAALARAREARARVLGGADFATVAREYSDDPTTRDKGGALPFISIKALAPEYAKSVFALTQIGQVSEPIKAPSAYHVVRLEERRAPRQQTFDEVRDTIMSDLRQRHIAEQRDLRLQTIHTDPGLQFNQAAIDALVNRIDPTLIKPPARGRSKDSAAK